MYPFKTRYLFKTNINSLQIYCFYIVFLKIDNTADPPRDICTNNEVCFAPH